jgi:hypothetical protein
MTGESVLQSNTVEGILKISTGLATIIAEVYVLSRKPLSRVVMLIRSILYIVLVIWTTLLARTNYEVFFTNPELKEVFVILGFIIILSISNIAFTLHPSTRAYFENAKIKT